MKPFVMLKIPMLLLGFGAALLLSPACKAQSEIAPDHFDGTDAWETAAHKPVPQKATRTTVALQARNQKPDSRAALQLASERDFSKPARQNAVAVPDKRKAAARKPKKQ